MSYLRSILEAVDPAAVEDAAKTASAAAAVYVVFPGRFQPFHNGHLDGVKDAVAKAGTRLTMLFILTSDIVGERSMLNFDERKILIEAGLDACTEIADARDKIMVKKMQGSPFEYRSVVKSMGVSKGHALVIWVTSNEDKDKRQVSTNTVSSPTDIERLLNPETIARRMARKSAEIPGFRLDAFEFSATAQMSAPRVDADAVSGTALRRLIAAGDWDAVQARVPYDVNKYKSILQKLARPLGEAVDPARAKKSAHVQHLAQGKPEAIAAMLDKLADAGAGLIVTQKMDGRPVITFGVDDNGFFVAMGGRQKIRTAEDVREYIAADPKGLAGTAVMFNMFLEYLPKLEPKCGYGADVLFYGGFGYRRELPGGLYGFKANSIWYAAKSDSATAEAIRMAKIGLAVHTRFPREGGVEAVTKDSNGLVDTIDVFIPQTRVRLRPMPGLHALADRIRAADAAEAAAIADEARDALLGAYARSGDLEGLLPETDLPNDMVLTPSSEGLVLHDEDGSTFKVVDPRFKAKAEEFHKQRRERKLAKRETI